MSRSIWKGPFVDPSLLKKVEKLLIMLEQRSVLCLIAIIKILK